jgi:hypothetical protein
MKCAVEKGSGAVIYTRSFIKIGSGIQRSRGEDKQTYRGDGDRISRLPSFSRR